MAVAVVSDKFIDILLVLVILSLVAPVFYSYQGEMYRLNAIFKRPLPFHLVRTSTTRNTRYLAVKKKSLSEDIENLMSKTGPGWVKVNLGDKNEEEMIMDDRLQDAERWQTIQLSDDDAEFINRRLNIDKEILQDADKPKKDGKKKKLLAMPELSEDEVKLRNLQGFLQINPFICSGCGTAFQSKAEDAPGYLRKEKFTEHREQAELIRQKQEAIKILEMADVDLDSPAAEEYLRIAAIPEQVIAGVKRIGKQLKHINRGRDEIREEFNDDYIKVDMNNAVDNIGTDGGLAEKICICQRCYRLQQYGKVEHSLRPGWSNHDLLTPEHFEILLSNIKNIKTVVLCLVDIFDLEGSILSNLKQIVGNNPVIIAANKVDLLPNDVSEVRIVSTIYDIVKRTCRFFSPNEYSDRHFGKMHSIGDGVLTRQDVMLISCQAGYGLDRLMNTIVNLAQEHGNSVHVMGAANSGKSSLINRLLEPSQKPQYGGKRQKKSTAPLVTVSNLPGTTLDFLKIKLPNGITVVDTPGLISKGHITSKLTTEELKQVIPVKPIKPITLRVVEGKCVLIGGLARIELTEVSKHAMRSTCLTVMDACIR
jgi:ribosome biogenesis GTPase A